MATKVQLIVVCLAIIFAAPKLLRPLAHRSISFLAPIDISSEMAGQTVIVTGGSTGVGLEAAKNFAARGASVIITSRSQDRAAAIAETLPSTTGLSLDLTDAASVKSFALAVKSRLGSGSLDVLVLNAGMVYGDDFVGPFASSFPGGDVDTMVAANHLGHFLLLQNLFKVVAESGTRVVVVASMAHHLATADAIFSDSVPRSASFVDGKTSSSPEMFQLYGATKTMNALTANKLNRLFALQSTAATAVLVTPGYAKTDIGLSNRSGGISNPFMNFPTVFSASEGGAMLVRAAAVNALLAGPGKMLQPYWIWEGVPLSGILKGVFHLLFQELGCQKLTQGVYSHSQSAVATNEAIQDQLWDWSMAMTGGKGNS